MLHFWMVQFILKENMNKIFTILFILINLICFSNKKLILVYERTYNEAALSANKIESKFKQLYPGINIVKPIGVNAVNYEIRSTKENELIFIFIGHSMPVPSNAVNNYGKIMFFLKDFKRGSHLSAEETKEHVYFSGDLIKSLKSIPAKKVVIIDGCYGELAYSNIYNTTWLFSCKSDQVNISIVGKGSVFMDHVYNNLSYNITISELSNSINNGTYSDKKFYDKMVTHEDYLFVKDPANYKNPYKSKYYGDYVF